MFTLKPAGILGCEYVNTVNTLLAHTRNPDVSESENGVHGGHGIHSPDNSGDGNDGSGRSDNSTGAAGVVGKAKLNGQDSDVTTGIFGRLENLPPSPCTGSSFLDLVEGEGVDLDDLDRMAPPDPYEIPDPDWSQVDAWLQGGRA